jgi:hypothetical protein
MKLKITISFFSLLIILAGCDFSNKGKTQILPAHAHNDYVHNRPLFDALDCKFKSIEADVFSMGDSLFVAHDRRQIKPGRTLRQLYLNPLKNIVNKNKGSVYGNSEEIILLVDIKDDGLKTYKLLHKILEDYTEILTVYNSDEINKGAITIIVSGNRPVDFMRNQEVRLAGFDGRVSDLASGIASSLMPLVSDNWNKYFFWKGEGEMPNPEKIKLTQIIKKAHANGYLLRFWATPDKPGLERDAVWNELINAKVDLIGSDDLIGLKNRLRNK